MVKPYTWEEIKDFLIKELKKTKHIMTFGTIGSCNVEHDIDLIITKKPSSSSSGFYKEIHEVFDKINDYLKKKYNANLIRFSKMEEEIINEYIGNAKKDDLLVHTMIYTSYPQMQKDWDWALFKDENIEEILKKNYVYLIGSLNDLFSREFMKENYYDPIFIYLYLGDKINSNYPEDLLVRTMNHSLDYLYRKRLKLKSPIAKNKEDIKKYFYELCDKLDELEKLK